MLLQLPEYRKNPSKSLKKKVKKVAKTSLRMSKKRVRLMSLP